MRSLTSKGCTARGIIEASGQTHDVDGSGLRDRTRGFRDESAQWLEYAAVVGIFDGVFVPAMKFLRANGGMRGSDGFVIDGAGTHSIADIRIRRTAAAQFLGATLSRDDGSVRTIGMTSRKAGFFVPMGAAPTGRRSAPMTTMALDCHGTRGAGVCEQGIIHRVCTTAVSGDMALFVSCQRYSIPRQATSVSDGSNRPARSSAPSSSSTPESPVNSGTLHPGRGHHAVG
jgi:hypothetical protein